MHLTLETERVALRRFTEDDVDRLVELDGDPDVMRYLTGGRATPRDVIQHDTLPRFLRSYDGGDGFGCWAAIEKSTGMFLGWVSFRPPEGDGSRGIELGYRLRKAAWGKGYAVEVSRVLIRRGFTELGVRRVFATTYQDNRASRRVMEKVGMTLVRTFRLTPAELQAAGVSNVAPEDLWDGYDVEYALEKADWEQREAAVGNG